MEIDTIVELPALKLMRLAQGVEMKSRTDLQRERHQTRLQSESSLLEMLQQQIPTVAAREEVISDAAEGSSFWQERRSGSRRRGSSQSHTGSIPDVSSTERRTSVGQKLRNVRNLQQSHVLEHEPEPGPTEGEEMTMRCALEDSQKAYEEFVRVREERAVAQSRVDASLKAEREQELARVSENSVRDEKHRHAMKNEEKQLDAVLQYSRKEEQLF